MIRDHGGRRQPRRASAGPSPKARRFRRMPPNLPAPSSPSQKQKKRKSTSKRRERPHPLFRSRLQQTVERKFRTRRRLPASRGRWRHQHHRRRPSMAVIPLPSRCTKTETERRRARGRARRAVMRRLQSLTTSAGWPPKRCRPFCRRRPAVRTAVTKGARRRSPEGRATPVRSIGRDRQPALRVPPLQATRLRLYSAALLPRRRPLLCTSSRSQGR